MSDPYSMAIGAVVGGFLGYIEYGGKKDLMNFQNAAAERIAGRKNSIRQSSNLAEAAQGNLARWSQSLSNQRHLENAGRALEATQINYRRARDEVVRRGFGEQLQRAEQLGAMAAQAGAAGTRGGVVDTITQATLLRQSMSDEVANQQKSQMDFDSRSREKTIASQMIGGMNSSVILETLDYGTDVAMKEAMQSRFDATVKGALQGSQNNYGAFLNADPDANQVKSTEVEVYGQQQNDLAALGRQQQQVNQAGGDPGDPAAAFQFNYTEDQQNYGNEGKNYANPDENPEALSSWWGF